MKPFRYYEAVTFPTLSLRNPIVSTMTQKLLLFYEKEDATTELRLVKPNHLDLVDRIVIHSGVWRNTNGYIRYPNPVTRKADKIDINGYVQPVVVDSYHDKQRKLAIIQAQKKVCRGIIKNLRAGDIKIELKEIMVDIDKVSVICPQFSAMTFRNVSTYMHSASVYGSHLQLDSDFARLAKMGEKSSIIINWIYKDETHPVMVTESGIVVLVNDYAKRPDTELRLILDVYDKIIFNAISSPKDDVDDPLDPTAHQVARTRRRKKKT